MIKGVICDLDGFLVETWKETPLPGVLEMLAHLRVRGIPVAVATNQAGPLWRIATGDEKYPSVEDVAARLLSCAQALSLADKMVAWYVALADERALGLLNREAGEKALKDVFYGFLRATRGFPLHILASDSLDWRKPNPTMLHVACAKWGFAPVDVIYGGDMESDRQAAARAGMRFVERLTDVLPLLLEREEPMSGGKEQCFMAGCERRVGIRNAQSVQIKGQWHAWHTCLYHMRIIEHMTPEELLVLADDQENLALLRGEKAQQAENTPETH